MKPAAFEYLRPASLAEALGQLARGGEGAKAIAGGQSLGPMMNMRLAQPRQLVDLNDLTELSYAREQGGWVEVGALTRHYQVAESPVVRELCPLLAQAAIIGYVRRVTFVTAVGVAVGIGTNVSYLIWYGFPGSYTIANIAMTVIGYFAAGLAIAAVLKRKAAA